jgi:hypothetical protein
MIYIEWMGCILNIDMALPFFGQLPDVVGRGTRVFEARLLDADGKEVDKPVTIKDVWENEDWEQEGDIYAAADGR